MAKRIPLPCTPANCGDNFPVCGSHSTYTSRKCRCDTCYEANAEYMKRYYAKNRETAIEWQKRYYAENREAAIERQKRYREANCEMIAEKKKIYIAENREAVAARRKRRYAENRETILERRRQCRAENSAAYAELVRQWRLANPERALEISRRGGQRRRARMMAATVVDFTQEQLEQRMAYYGNSCYLKLDCCTGGFEHVDHVKPISKHGPHMLANLRPACAPCNIRKKDKWPFKH